MAAATHPYRRTLEISSTRANGEVEANSRRNNDNKNDSLFSLSSKTQLNDNGELFDKSFKLSALPSPPTLLAQRAVSSPVSSLSETPGSSRIQLVDSRESSNDVGEFNDSGSGSTKFKSKKTRPKSVDLSHLYLMSNGNTQYTSTNESVADLSHQMISKYLGEENNSILVPRLKTIAMYKQNVKKSKDPNVLFQYAQYILQTALSIDVDSTDKIQDETETNDGSVSPGALKKQFLKDAQHYLRKLSVKGYSDAQYLLADAYASGAFGKVNTKEAFVLFQSAAKHGHIESAYRTAHCYEEGLGTTRDSRRAIEFLKFAGSRNHPSATYKLGLYSFYGRMGMPNDINTKQNGIKWLSRATARANELTCAAPYELAKIYDNGFMDIIIPDQKYAMELYNQAASLGHSPSSTILGRVYETGNDVVPQDTSLSVHYYTQAALRGDPEAMMGLCAWYIVGAEPSFDKDEKEAFQWALRAATAGFAKAQFAVAYFYEKGKGCEVDMDSAMDWYQKAADQKDPRAINKLQTNGNGTPFKPSHSKKSKSISTLNLFASNSTQDFRNTSGSTEHSTFKKPSGSAVDLRISATERHDRGFEQPIAGHENLSTAGAEPGPSGNDGAKEFTLEASSVPAGKTKRGKILSSRKSSGESKKKTVS
ncbi:LAMI_0D12618g1_1 [Lachancea mirantina]|uniref:LAMI_0D12618g1_1 n=1 Tax=Lachancea mirantina TaxID=1230905 RepID=A0A1G4JGD9_9SACH|nr:LAMI_0D12618g1_1 [Lachancea mirantina]